MNIQGRDLVLDEQFYQRLCQLNLLRQANTSAARDTHNRQVVAKSHKADMPHGLRAIYYTLTHMCKGCY